MISIQRSNPFGSVQTRFDPVIFRGPHGLWSQMDYGGPTGPTFSGVRTRGVHLKISIICIYIYIYPPHYIIPTNWCLTQTLIISKSLIFWIYNPTANNSLVSIKFGCVPIYGADSEGHCRRGILEGIIGRIGGPKLDGSHSLRIIFNSWYIVLHLVF